MVDSVISSYQNQKYINKSRKEYKETSNRIINGKPQSFAELAAHAGSPKDAIVLQARYRDKASSINHNKLVANELIEYIDIVDQTLEIAMKFRSDLISTDADLDTLSTAYLNQLESIINRPYLNDKYLLSGGANKPPVKNLDKQTNVVNGPFTTNYYQGSNMSPSVMLNNKNTEYGFTAAEPALSLLIGSIHLAKDTKQPKIAGDVLEQAIDKLITLMTENGNKLAAVESVIELDEKIQSQNQKKVNQANGAVEDAEEYMNLNQREIKIEAGDSVLKREQEMRRNAIRTLA